MVLENSISKDESVRSSRWLGICIQWFLIALVGFALIRINLVGHFPESYIDFYANTNPVWIQYRGWPMMISCDDDFFGIYWIFTNIVIAMVILYCTSLSLKYVYRRWKKQKQLFLSEILIVMTTASIILAFITSLDFMLFHYDGLPSYQPLHLLPLYLQIPIWFGLLCTAGVLATVMVDGVRFLLTRKNRSNP
jgi:hypothetical protein